MLCKTANWYQCCSKEEFRVAKIICRSRERTDKTHRRRWWLQETGSQNNEKTSIGFLEFRYGTYIFLHT